MNKNQSMSSASFSSCSDSEDDEQEFGTKKTAVNFDEHLNSLKGLPLFVLEGEKELGFLNENQYYSFEGVHIHKENKIHIDQERTFGDHTGYFQREKQLTQIILYPGKVNKKDEYIPKRDTVTINLSSFSETSNDFYMVYNVNKIVKRKIFMDFGFFNYYLGKGEKIHFLLPSIKGDKKSFVVEDKHGNRSIFIVFGYENKVLTSIIIIYKKGNMGFTRTGERWFYPWELINMKGVNDDLGQRYDQVLKSNAIKSNVEFRSLSKPGNIKKFNVPVERLDDGLNSIVFDFSGLQNEENDLKTFSKFRLTLPLQFEALTDSLRNYMKFSLDLSLLLKTIKENQYYYEDTPSRVYTHATQGLYFNDPKLSKSPCLMILLQFDYEHTLDQDFLFRLKKVIILESKCDYYDLGNFTLTTGEGQWPWEWLEMKWLGDANLGPSYDIKLKQSTIRKEIEFQSVLVPSYKRKYLVPTEKLANTAGSILFDFDSIQKDMDSVDLAVFSKFRLTLPVGLDTLKYTRKIFIDLTEALQTLKYHHHHVRKFGENSVMDYNTVQGLYYNKLKTEQKIDCFTIWIQFDYFFRLGISEKVTQETLTYPFKDILFKLRKIVVMESACEYGPENLIYY
jgi:hypothetical protein